MKAIHESLVLTDAWRIAKPPSSQLYLVLKAKYFHHSSIWTTTSSSPESSFWTSVLKMIPKLKAHSFCQLTQRNISIRSTRWCTLWDVIHDHPIIQQPGFRYSSLVRDLWLPWKKVWNNELVHLLFQQPMASIIVQTGIIDDDGLDLLCRDLTPNVSCSFKYGYKICLQEIHANPRVAPSILSLELKDLLKLVWK